MVHIFHITETDRSTFFAYCSATSLLPLPNTSTCRPYQRLDCSVCDVSERYEAKLRQEMGCSTRGKKKKRPKCVVLILHTGRFPRIHFGDRYTRLQALCATDLHLSTGHDMIIEERKGNENIKKKCKNRKILTTVNSVGI